MHFVFVFGQVPNTSKAAQCNGSDRQIPYADTCVHLYWAYSLSNNGGQNWVCKLQTQEEWVKNIPLDFQCKTSGSSIGLKFSRYDNVRNVNMKSASSNCHSFAPRCPNEEFFSFLESP